MSRAPKGQPVGLHATPNAYLTKGAFTDYLKCPGYAWLKRHQPHVLPEIGEVARQRMLDGIEMDRLAHTRFTDGVLIDELDMAAAMQHTSARLRWPETSVLFQATLAAEPGFLARGYPNPGW